MRLAERMYLHDSTAMSWQPTGNPDIVQKSIRVDASRGQFLGLVMMRAMSRTGLHRHLGVGGGLVLSGQVTDYFVDQGPGDYAINHANTVHDAVALSDTLMAVRLEAPQVFLDPADVLHYDNGNRMARPDEGDTPQPEQPPEITVNLGRLPNIPTSVAGVARRLVFDYAHMESNHRIASLRMLPRTSIPAFQTGDLLEWLVLGGVLEINGHTATTGCYVIAEPGAEVVMASRYGAKLLAWSHAPIAWNDGNGRPDLFGF